MKYRKSKNSDLELTEKAYQLLLNLVQENQQDIEPALWVGAMIGALAENYNNSDIPFEYFKKEIIDCVNHYKY